MQTRKLRVAVLGAGKWAEHAHIPGWKRDPRVEVVVLADVVRERAEELGRQLSIPEVTTDWQSAVSRPDVDVVDVVTPSSTHFELAIAALESGKHVLCEKPVAYDYRETRRASELARKKGLKTKLGFTFRYSPGVQYARSLLDEGFVGRVFFFNGYEQNSQWLDPEEPLRQSDPEADPSVLQTSSLEGYGAPIIDIGHWWVGADLARVVGVMTNFIPERRVRGLEGMRRMNIDDGDIFIGEHVNGALTSIQTSFVTIGNYPGVEARVYGDRGRHHLPSRRGAGRRRDHPRRDQRRGRVSRARDSRALLPGGRPCARVLAEPVLRQPHPGLHRRDSRGRHAESGRLRGRRVGPGDHQRRRALVPRAPLGLAPPPSPLM